MARYQIKILHYVLIFNRYVCISGAADQLQSNYAGDFRSILRTVFQMNVTQDEDESPSKEKAADENDEEEINPESLPTLDQPPIPEAEGDSGTEVNVDTTHTSENSTDRDIGVKSEIIKIIRLFS